MLTVDHVSKRYADKLVLDAVSFTVSDGDHIALVGSNGCGKSTLLRIIVGEEEPDSGGVSGSFAREGSRYLPQGALDADVRVAADLAPAMGNLWRCGVALSAGADDSSLDVLAALEQLEASGGWAAFADVEAILRGLGIDYLRPEAPGSSLSGGERTKLGLASLLYRPGNFLLLDEPTNHLDLVALDWLEGFLRGFAGALLLVSHDRAFIDRVAASVLEIDAETHRLRRFAGGYSDYAATRMRERETALDAYQRQQEEVARIETDIRRVKDRASKFDTTSANDHWRRIGKKVARTAKVRERKLEKLLSSTERLEKPALAWSLKADIAEAERSGDLVIEANDVTVAFGDRTVLDRVSLLLRHGERLVLTGPNGSGKTTFLRVLVGEQRPDSGTVRLGPSVKAGYLSQQQESLNLDRTPVEEIRLVAAIDETAARTFLHRFLFSGDEVFTANRRLSFGQRSRLALAKLILSGVNLLVLDEPLNHLDIESRERFEEALAAFHGTVVAVSHDRYFIQRFARQLLVLAHGSLAEGDTASP